MFVFIACQSHHDSDKIFHFGPCKVGRCINTTLGNASSEEPRSHKIAAPTLLLNVEFDGLEHAVEDPFAALISSLALSKSEYATTEAVIMMPGLEVPLVRDLFCSARRE